MSCQHKYTSSIIKCQHFRADFVLFRPIGFLASKDLNYVAFQYFEMSVSDEGYSITCRVH